MFRNYLRISFRNVFKQKVYSFINISGLTVGITCCLLIYFYVGFELSYDGFHKKADRIYRLVVDIFPPNDGLVDHYATSGPGVAPVLESDYPEVEKAVRIRSIPDVLLKWGENQFYETFHFADSTFFDVFSFPLLLGDPVKALTDPFSLVLTEEMANKYFGTEDPLGKVVLVQDTVRFKITGVVKNVPANAHFTFDFLASYNTLPRMGRNISTWWSFGGYNYLLLTEGANPTAFSEKIRHVSEKYIPEQEKGSGYRQEYYLQSITAIHLNSERRSEWQANNKLAYIYIFSAIGIFILLIACINFMNLATARSIERSKEVGIRKVVGALRSQIAKQFLGEAIVLALISTVLSVFAMRILVPFFNDLTGKQLTINIANNFPLILIIVLLPIIVGVIAGSYPALFLSAFKPIDTVKGAFKSGTRGINLRKSLVVFQFAISVTLIISTLVIHKQLTYMRNQKLGFSKEQILVLPLHHDAGIRKKYELLKNRFLQNPQIDMCSISSGIPGRRLNNSVFRIEGNRVDSQYGTDAWNDMRFINVDTDFADIYNLEMLSGRFFSQEFETDAQSAFILNEAAVKKFDWGVVDRAIGKKIGFQSSSEGKVIGVVKNFHFKSLQSLIEPLIITSRNFSLNYISIKISGTGIRETLESIENVWNEFVPNRPFSFFFLDDEFDKQYRADEKVAGTFTAFAFIAIFVACLGLFGLASFTTEQRTKEIGIRKVLGASMAGIIKNLSADFIKLIILANLVAWPVSYFLMQKWLQDFAYRIDPNVLSFFFAGFISVAIAILTISYQAIKASLANPIDALRYE
ncbi:ABC transporter permease [candidate division KSB1 bacterium]|nr:ABC transporter permease [candidate division KSB1 bacterium]